MPMSPVPKGCKGLAAAQGGDLPPPQPDQRACRTSRRHPSSLGRWAHLASGLAAAIGQPNTDRALACPASIFPTWCVQQSSMSRWTDIIRSEKQTERQMMAISSRLAVNRLSVCRLPARGADVRARLRQMARQS